MDLLQQMQHVNHCIVRAEGSLDKIAADRGAISVLVDRLDGLERYKDGRDGLVFLLQAIDEAKRAKTLKGRKQRRAVDRVERKFNAAIRALDRFNKRQGGEVN